MDYRNHRLFSELNEFMERLKLTQVVNFETWERVVENIVRTSILDHINTADPESISSLKAIRPPIGDHKELEKT